MKTRRHFTDIDPSENPPPQMLKDKFKEGLKIGQSVRNRVYHETGVVAAKYEHVFTVISEHEYMQSYTYNSFMEFER